jgi:ABC-type polysaccharide/polyol phosphate export permease
MIDYLRRIWACRYFWLSLVQIDLRTRYRRSFLGVGWSLLRPIAFTAILCTVFRRLFHRADVWDYAPFVLSGLMCWDYFVTATKQGCQCFFQGEAYIRQHPSPVAIFPLRTALTESFHFLVALAVLVTFVCWLHGLGRLLVLWCLVPTLILMFLLAWSLALLAGYLNVYFQDTQHLCDVGFQVLFYATPILYRPEDLGGGRLSWVVAHCNPLVPFFQLVREPLLFGQVPSLETYALAATVVLALGGVASLACARLQKELVFQL